MKTPENVLEALNTQVGMEFAASLKYESIASYFTGESLPRLAAFYTRQAEEERGHAHRFMKFILDVGGVVKIPAVAASPWDFKTAEGAAKIALESELAVTASIEKIYDMALEAKAHAASHLLQWFINEQVEEVAVAEQLLRIIQRAGESGLLLVEDYLAQNAIGEKAAGEE
jgi:bacterioferritin B